MSGRLLAIVSSVAVVAAIVAAILLVGGPHTARLQRLDNRRETDLRVLADWIESYRIREGHLPADLAELEPVLPGGISTVDPVTGTPYGYDKLDKGHFRICAELAFPAKQAARRRPDRPFPDSDRRAMRVIGSSGHRLCLVTGPAP